MTLKRRMILWTLLALLAAVPGVLVAQPSAALYNPGGPWPASVTADPYEPNNTPGDATPLAFGDARNGLIDPAGDLDYYVFHADDATFILAEVDAGKVGSPLDAALTLYAADGTTVLATDDNSAAGNDPRIAFGLPAAGDYYLKVDAAAGAGPNAFYWLFLSTSDPNEPNDRVSQATSLVFNEEVAGTIDPLGDGDYYQFTARGGLVIAVTVEARVDGSRLAPYLTLFDRDGYTPLKSDGDNWQPYLEYTLPSDGTYYILITPCCRPEPDYQYNAGPDYFYRLVLTQVTDAFEPNDDLASATPLVLDTSMSGTIAPTGELDYYRIDGIAGEVLSVDFDRIEDYQTFRLVVAFLGPDGAALTEQTTSPFYVRLPADGTYFVRVMEESHWGRVSAHYRLTVSDYSPTLLISAAVNGVAGGVAFTPGDILQHRVGTDEWAMFFDASDVGITRNVTAFSSNYDLDRDAWGPLYLVITPQQNIPGSGVVGPHDVLGFRATTFGSETSGTLWRTGFNQYWPDFFDVLLKGQNEAIDAIRSVPYYGSGGYSYVISTTGSFKVPDFDTGYAENDGCAGRDEDIVAFYLDDEGGIRAGCWLSLDGSMIPGLGGQDITGLAMPNGATAFSSSNYVSLGRRFTVAGVSGGADDILAITKNGDGSYQVAKVWDGQAEGFPYPIDGIELSGPILGP